MAMAGDREIRRHLLRFLAKGEEGRALSRIVYQQLIDYGHRITWSELDRHILYLERAGCLVARYVHPSVDRVRWLEITQKGLDLVEGSLREPGIMPPDEI